MDCFECDYIIITSTNRKTAERLEDFLKKKCPQKKDKILSYYIHSISENYRNKIHNFVKSEKMIEGVILGNSHARDGILTKYMSHNFINLSFSSQDLYYNFVILKNCFEEYSKVFLNIKYIILDLWDYNILNYDCSLTDSIYVYWNGGVLDPHNYLKREGENEKSFNEILKEQYGIVTDNIERQKLLSIFEDINAEVHEDDLKAESSWDHISLNPSISTSYLNGGVIHNKHIETISENKKVLWDFVEYIKNVNPNIHIIFSLLPRYYDVEYIMRPFVKEWKYSLYELINDIIVRYSKDGKILFCDFKENYELSRNHFFYKDVHHFNTVGGINQTYLFNHVIDSLG